MKVMMVPNALNLASSESDIHTVVRKYFQHAPAAGIEFVGSQTGSFDVLAVHAGMSKEYPIAGPFVVHLHELYFTADYSADLGEYQANRDAIDAIRYATTITVPSDWVAESLRRDMHLQPRVLGYGIDWQEWQHGEPNDGYVLWNKNRATAGCDPAPVGELAKRFPQQRFLTTFAPKNPTPNVIATGVLTHDQTHKIMQRAGIYLATTKETGGIGILESTAAGIPVLGFRHGAILDMVQHGVNGYLAKPGDYDDLANGLEYCLKHRDMLGANGRELARQFTWQRVMEQLHGIYDATIQHFHQPPRVSVIIPCYNYSHILERAVQSVLAQTHQPWEIIIVDNNSTDNTAQVAHNLAQQYRTVRYTNCEKQGVAHARNWGIEQAVGKYIVCLDADDEIKPPFIEVCLQALLADPSLGLAYTKMERVWQDGQRCVFEWPVEYNFDGFLKKHNAVPTCCMFRRDLWQRLGGYRQRYAPRGAGAEDAEFWMRMGALGYRGKLASKEPLFSYYMGGSVSGTIGYREPDWLAGKPYVTDGQHPLASMATPAKPSHPVRQYDEPVVSVVIPCDVDHAHCLTDALDSLEAQTFRQWEAIVVCDGFSIPADLLTAFPFVRAVQTDNVDAEAARNAGAAIARGAFLLFLDTDEWQRPQAIQRMLQKLQQEHAIIKSDVELLFEQRNNHHRGDSMPINRAVLSKYSNKIFVETGTYMGDTSALALHCGFERVLTVELSNNWRGQYQTRFGNDSRVRLFAGLSKDRLPEMLAQVDAPATFWLDAHYSGGGTALGDKLCPLLEELDLIADHWIKTHTILIDDVRLFGDEFGPDVTVERVKEKLLTINPSYQFHFEDGNAPNDILVAALPHANRSPDPLYSHPHAATVTAYALYEHAATLQLVPDEPAWAKTDETVAANLALSTAGGRGWELLCPYAVEITWNGGPAPEDIDIRSEAPDADAPAFVQSSLGAGLLTFYPGYQFKTETTTLWLRGPINLPKDGLYPLESIVDTSLLPCTISIHWKCTRPQQTIRFEAGEPFGTILPYPKPAAEDDAEHIALEVVPLDTDVEAYERAFQQLIADPAVQHVFQRLGSAGAETIDEPTDEATTSPTPRESTPSRWAAQLTDPPVSCICPTYGRVELLEEAIYSFLQQDYPGQKELIVLNDYAEQTLEFEHPEVRIVNVPIRFNSVGEKYKAAAGLCTHDLIVVWHDDDIYLPHRLSFSVAHFDPRRGFFKANSAWFWNDGRLSGPERNNFHGGSCFSRELFLAAQGYPHVGNAYDIGFEVLCEDLRTGATRGDQITPEDVYYIYRWAGTGSYHLSLTGQNGHGRDAVAAHVREQAERGQIKQGQIRLAPHWKTDYTALVRNYLDNGPAKPAEAVVPFPPPFFVIPGPQPMDAAAAEQLFRGTHPARISVILPALNESVLLQRTVEQFEATLPANCEIIVVDNGSTDGSADFLADRNCNCNTVSLIQSAKPLGVAGARNRGLAAARGEVVVFADAHIDLPEHWWQPVVATLNQPNVGVVGPGIGIIGQPEHKVAYAQRIAEPNLRVEWLGWQQREPYPVPTLGGGFMAMRRETLECAGGFDPGMSQWGSEDLELCMRYWLLGYEVWVVPDVTILHYFRTENPLKVKPGIVTHNVLRVALLHFNQERIARVVSALKTQGDFGHAMAHAVESDVWQRRAEFAARRARDDDWLFEKFADSCSV